MNRLLNVLLVAILILPSGFALGKSTVKSGTGKMQDVLSIAKKIRTISPNLENAKYVAYAIAIHRASTRYDLDANLLVAIAQQESGFREDLPEGKAGEIGMCQVLKRWLAHKGFKKEFGTMKVKELQKPSNNIMVAAWILKSLQKSGVKSALPFWSFYNAHQFMPRLKYVQRVSEKFKKLYAKAE